MRKVRPSPRGAGHLLPPGQPGTAPSVWPVAEWDVGPKGGKTDTRPGLFENNRDRFIKRTVAPMLSAPTNAVFPSNGAGLANRDNTRKPSAALKKAIKAGEK